jgi:GTP cyclohydrolase I
VSPGEDYAEEQKMNDLDDSGLPDIAQQRLETSQRKIQRVGMEGIEIPVCVRDASGIIRWAPARVDVFVSLDRTDAKGIHMSRLLLAVQEVLTKEELQIDTIAGLLETLLQSHCDLSRTAEIAISFDLMVERQSLASGLNGWRSYPITIRSLHEAGRFEHELGFQVTYSSTCPCSAALARQRTRGDFLERFGESGRVSTNYVASWLLSEEGVPATPHSQRSHATLRVVLDSSVESFDYLGFIDPVEDALGTPVQAVVKRADEQAFAALNGQNLMFCEDAVRKIGACLEASSVVEDYRIEVRHEESLHPHDAVAILTKEVEGGLAP